MIIVRKMEKAGYGVSDFDELRAEIVLTHHIQTADVKMNKNNQLLLCTLSQMLGGK